MYDDRNELDVLKSIECLLEALLERIPEPDKPCDTKPGDWCEVHQGIHEDEAR